MRYKISVKIKHRLFENSLRISFPFWDIYKNIIFFNHVNYQNFTEMYTENRARSASVTMRRSLKLREP